MILQDLNTVLESEHPVGLIKGVNLFIENAPAEVDKSLTLSLGVSGEVNNYNDVNALEVQVYSRAKSAYEAYDMLVKVRDVFEDIKHQEVVPGSNFVYRINWSRYPQYLMLDDNNRYTYTSSHTVYLRGL